MENNKKEVIKKLIWIAIGQLIAAIGFSRVMVANGIIASGFGGISTILYEMVGMNIQLSLVMMAIPVFVWSFFCYEKKQIFYAGFSFFIFTFYVGIVEKCIPVFETDMIVASIAGGVIMGFASGLVMKQRVANGPESIVALYLKQKTGLTIGNFFLVLNVIVIFSALLYGDLTIIIYSFIATYIQSTVTDLVIIGGTKFYNVNIMSDNYLDITDYIHNNLKRGATFVKGMDTSNVSKKMLVQTVVTGNELVNLKAFIKELEDDSFVYASQCSSIIGRGIDLE